MQTWAAEAPLSSSFPRAPRNVPTDNLMKSSSCAEPHGQDAPLLNTCTGEPPAPRTQAGSSLRHPRSGWQRGVGASSASLPPHQNEHCQGFRVDIIGREENKETPSPDACWSPLTCHPYSGHFQLRRANASPNPPSSPHLPISPFSPSLPPPISPTSPAPSQTPSLALLPPSTSPCARGHGTTYTNQGTQLPLYNAHLQILDRKCSQLEARLKTCIFGFSLFSSSFFPPFLPCTSCLLSSGFPRRTSSLHFSIALYITRPNYNGPGFKRIITTMTVITIKHSFNGNKKITKK